MILAKFIHLHEVNELLHSLNVVANLLLTAVSPDPAEPLVRYIEQNLRVQPSIKARMCISSEKCRRISAISREVNEICIDGIEMRRKFWKNMREISRKNKRVA